MFFFVIFFLKKKNKLIFILLSPTLQQFNQLDLYGDCKTRQGVCERENMLFILMQHRRSNGGELINKSLSRSFTDCFGRTPSHAI